MDAINDAIDIRRKISFRYTNYDINKKRRVANGGIPYTVSPYTMMWDGDYYYLLGYCDERQAMRTFRLDRIERQPVILNETNTGFVLKTSKNTATIQSPTLQLLLYIALPLSEA